MFAHISSAFRVAAFVLLWHCLPFVAIAETNHHVILITIDGFAAYYLADPQAPIPTIRRLAAEGTAAEGMRVSNPSVTWPNHTTLVTGVHPDKHSVFFNGVLVRPGPEMAVKVDPQRDKSDLVAVPTLYDLLHRAGYRTAGINWPCTRRAPTLDDDFPDVPDQILHTTPRLRDELIAAGILQNASQQSFQSQSSARKDQIWTAAAAHVIQKRRPNYMLVHMLITDSTQHKYAPQSPAAYTAFALADAQIAELLRAIEAAGIRDRTTILVTADHGFETALKIVNPNVVFRKAGLLETSATPNILKARVQIISEGGIAMVYITNPARLDEDRAHVITLMSGHEGIAEILKPEHFAALHLPDPLKNRQMADLILVAKQGYAFSNDAHGERSVTEVTLASGNQGHHGYLSTNPKMNAAFVAWGRGIKSGVKLGLIDNIDVAPTIAALLGQKIPGVDGKVLQEMLKAEAVGSEK
jgi:predicted AlkP superfamily pyrophosphatase or phosphodiesterase